jgi:hypothetical protein
MRVAIADIEHAEVWADIVTNAGSYLPVRSGAG